ncbi:hypothetical protein D1007_51217 [Hordeum vulgare]|nr:hypothetical protein D1007_51217 [Hordeum vulgare]
MASRSSSSPPAAAATKTITRLLAVRGYAKLGQTPPGTPSTKVKTLYFNRHLWHVKATPCGFLGGGVPGSLAVHVSTVTYNNFAVGTTISIEILDGAMERAVFRSEQVLGADAWSKHLMVDRSALEAAGCVRNDYVPVRITLTFFDEKEHRRLQRAAAMAEWCRRLKRSFFDFDGSSLVNLCLGLVLRKCHSLNTDKVRPGPVTFLNTKQQHHQQEETKMVTAMRAASKSSDSLLAPLLGAIYA